MKDLDVSYPHEMAERRLNVTAGALTLDELACRMSVEVERLDPVSVRDTTTRPIRHSAVYRNGNRLDQRPHLSQAAVSQAPAKAKSRPKAQPVTGIQTFADGRDAFALASRMARYGHRHWLVWKVKGQDGRRCAKLTIEVLEQAMAECDETDAGKPIVSQIEAGTAQGINVARWMMNVWLSNMRGGCFSYS